MENLVTEKTLNPQDMKSANRQPNMMMRELKRHMHECGSCGESNDGYVVYLCKEGQRLSALAFSKEANERI